MRHPVLITTALTLILASCSGPATPSSTLPPPIPLADRQIEVLEVPGSPDWLVAGFGSVWAKRDNGDVLRIDPVSHEVVATIEADVTGSDLCQGIGADETSIWACSMSDIVRIDPTTNKVADVVEARKIHVQGRLVAIAGRIWILTGTNAEELVGVHSATLDVGEPIALGVACSDLAVGDGAIWAACPQANIVLRIDPVAGSVTHQIEVEAPGSISVGADAAWVGSADGIVRINLADRSTRLVAEVLRVGGLGAVWASASAIWVRTQEPFLAKIDPATSQVSETITSQAYGAGDVIGLDGTLWASDSEAGVIVHLRSGPE